MSIEQIWRAFTDACTELDIAVLASDADRVHAASDRVDMYGEQMDKATEVTE